MMYLLNFHSYVVHIVRHVLFFINMKNIHSIDFFLFRNQMKDQYDLFLAAFITTTVIFYLYSHA